MQRNVFLSMGIGSVETWVAGGEAAVSADTMQVNLVVALEWSKPVTEGVQWGCHGAEGPPWGIENKQVCCGTFPSLQSNIRGV